MHCFRESVDTTFRETEVNISIVDHTVLIMHECDIMQLEGFGFTMEIGAWHKNHVQMVLLLLLLERVKAREDPQYNLAIDKI